MGRPPQSGPPLSRVRSHRRRLKNRSIRTLNVRQAKMNSYRHASWGLIVVLCAATGCLALRRTATVSGVVVDMHSGKPISDAKVVLTTWHAGIWHSSPENFGTLTDDDGTFSFCERPGYRIQRIDLAASTPDDKYRHLPDFRGTHAVLEVAPLANGEAPIDQLRYRTFGGAYIGEVTWRELPNQRPERTGVPPAAQP